MAKQKEPIYMKWWVWIIIFLITAIIVNYTTEEAKPPQQTGQYTSTQPQPDADPQEEELAAQVMRNITNDQREPATFLIGPDLPAGEYFVMAGTGEFGYLLLTRTQHLDVSDLIWQKHFENHTIITLQDNQYLTVKNATLLPIDDAIVPNFENNRLLAGTYRVGIDIPPGIYTLFPSEDQVGFFEITDSSQFLISHVRERRNFNEPVIIALNLGDYLTFMRAEIQK